jgi:hypothetical protein
MTSVPPKISQSNHRFATAVVAFSIIGTLAVLFCFNPATHHFYPVCLFHQLTGLNCPGCGMTRAMYALLHGDFLTALRDNAFLLLVLTVAGLRGLWLSLQHWRGRAVGVWVPVTFIWPLLFTALVFTILRNLPAFAFLSPT